jgi:pimeloyl-ACP methyl ester carboxylesterase
MLWARNFGQGARRVLALHCSLSHSGAWRPLSDVLGDVLTFVAPDLPGHGKSPDWDGKTEYQKACVDTLDPFLQEPADIVAHSFAATVALRLAIEQPQNVRSLFLIEPVLFAAARADETADIATFEHMSADYVAALKRSEYELAARLFNRLWGDGRPWSEIPMRIRDYMAKRMPIIAAQTPALTQDYAGLLAPGRLEQVQVPAVLLRGDQSPPITKNINRALAARLPNGAVAEISGAGHMAPITHPEAVAEKLRAFLEVA